MNQVVTLLCPNLKCRKLLQVPAGVRGKPVRCSHCGNTLLVPARRGQAEATPAPAQSGEKPAK